ELQEVLVGGFLHEGEAGNEERAASAVLESAPALVVEVQDEEVAVAERQATEDAGERVDDLGHVRNGAARVEVTPAPHHQLVRNPLRGEALDRVRRLRPHLEWAVRQFVVVGPDGQLEAAEAVGDPDPPYPIRADAPGLLVDLLDRELASGIVARRQSVDVPLVLADEVAPRSPDGEPQVDRWLSPGVAL